MRASEFRSASIALLRSTVGWQSGIARRLEVDPRTVRRWLAEGKIPGWAAERMAVLMGGLEDGPWPRDEWIVGDGVSGDGVRREYVIHTQPPRFIARAVMTDEDDEADPREGAANLISGVVFVASPGMTLCEIEWIDEPTPGEITGLLEAAANALVAAA